MAARKMGRFMALFFRTFLLVVPAIVAQNSSSSTSTTANPLSTTSTAVNPLFMTPTTSSPLTVTPPPVSGTANATDGGSAASADRISLTVGLLFPGATSRQRSLVGFGQSAPAINLALARARSEHLIDNVDFSFVWYIGDCNQTMQTGYAIELIQWYQVDAIVGPPCSTAAIMAGSVATFYNIPILAWGPTTASTLFNNVQYITMVSLNTQTYKLALAIRALLVEYKWLEFALLYAPDDVQLMCQYLSQDLDTVLASTDPNNPTIIYKQLMTYGDMNSITQALYMAKNRSRIIVACFDTDTDKQSFLIAADNLGINTNNEYVFIMPNIRAEGMYSRATNGTPIGVWLNNTDSTRNADTMQSAALMITIDLPNMDANTLSNFALNMLANEGQPPFNCTGMCLVTGDPNPATATIDNSSAIFASSLFDTFYMYALMINRTANVTGMSGAALKSALRNGTLVANGAITQTQFQGLTGLVKMNANGSRDPIFAVTAFDAQQNPTVFLNISVSGAINNVSVIHLYSDASTSIWAGRGGIQPVYKPECGYTGTDCPVNVTLWVGLGVAVVALFVLTSTAIVAYVVRLRLKQQERLNNESLIPYHSLRRIDPKAKSAEALRSHGSLRSSHSSAPSASGSATTQRSSDLSLNVERLETENHAYFHYVGGEVIYAQKYPVRMKFTNEHMLQLRRLREFDHDNANKLLGLCVDGPQLMAVWKYCHRGSLQDVIARGSFISDQFVVFALIRDIVNGLRALHSSPIAGVHGNLTSQCCLVNDRWQLKISDYGLGLIDELQPTRRKTLMWRSPELLRAGDRRGTSEGDVYSFGIICSELVNRENAWSGAIKEAEIDEIVYRVKKGTDPPFRPELKPDEEVNPALMHLIRDCWSENPSNRPKLDVVRSLIKQMVKNGDQNLMDYVFSMMEVYANSLEQEVTERTKQLVEEKRKSDILLYRMLPRQVADKLRVGEVLQPEQFEAATVFFSDVVSFTVLASRCTPLQVVNLLNELYSTFDNIIDIHDAYKVETIGDGYLIVSGIPHRNGDQHSKEIAELALDFMRALPRFRIPHLPNERINLRIGIHTGPAVAGVVGLTMPRYCLFGDTVNTASRMESNGRAGMIHISPVTNTYLTTIIGGYVTEPRGEVIIKGKGVMETYWLVGKGDPNDRYVVPQPTAVAAPPEPAALENREPFTGGKATED